MPFLVSVWCYTPVDDYKNLRYKASVPSATTADVSVLGLQDRTYFRCGIMEEP